MKVVTFGEETVQKTPALHYTGLLDNPFSNSDHLAHSKLKTTVDNTSLSGSLVFTKTVSPTGDIFSRSWAKQALSTPLEA